MGSKKPQLTKHEQILNYIEGLKPGQKISVRQIAKQMEVSEGTAYRAIKEAENLGIVNTKERIGTVRIDRPQRHMDQLSFEEVVDIVDGNVLGGESGLKKSLNKFVIGAMELDAMVQYIDAGSLLIVGNREDAHRIALEQGAGVLVTGGFDTSEEVKVLADQSELPIISSKYDTFTVASLINRAMYDRVIKKKIMLVEDVMQPSDSIYTLKSSQTVGDWKALMEETGFQRFPVLDERGKVVGIVTSKDVVSVSHDQSIDRVMTRNPLTVTLHTSIASASHMMVWEGIELLPVIDHSRKLLGVISRQDVLKAMQMTQNESQLGETFEDQIWSSFSEKKLANGQTVYTGMVTPQMSTQLGTVSEGVINILVALAAYRMVKDQKRGDLVLDNITCYYIRPLQIESVVTIAPKVIEMSRKFGKIEVDVMHHDTVVCKAMLTAQVLEQS